MKLHLHRYDFGLLMAFLICLAGCQDYVSSIPDSPVYLKRNIYTDKLRFQGNFLYVNTTKLATDRIGFGGILIVHINDDEFDGYYAFDLACPVEVNRNVRIGKPDQLLRCKCDSCGEEYNLIFGLGDPLNHISKEGLRRYKVRFEDYDIFIYR